jgi:hypothetical protein
MSTRIDPLQEETITRSSVFAGLVVFLVVLSGCGGSQSGEASPATTGAEASLAAPAPDEPTLEEVRALTERFRNVEVALAEGYIRDPSDACITAEMEGRPATDGAMGVHYFRPDMLELAGPPDPLVDGTGTHIDFRNPSVVIYEPQPDGSLELVAVENLVFAAAWRAAGNTEPPTFHGVPFDYMENDPATDVDEAHGFAPHYDRHVWLYRENPNGVFTPMNPNVTCAHHTGAAGHAHPS